MASRATQRDLGRHFFSLFSDFGGPWDPKGGPREPKRASKSPKRRPKWSQSAQKAIPESDFFDFYNEKLLFSISIPLCSGIGGFTTPDPPRMSTLGPLGLQKANKKASKTRDEIKHAKNSPIEGQLMRKSAPGPPLVEKSMVLLSKWRGSAARAQQLWECGKTTVCL